MRTSRPSLSWTSAAMRRACSSGVKQAKCSRLLGRIEAPRADGFADRRRYFVADVLAEREACAEIARGHRRRIDLEEEHAFRVLEVLQHCLKGLAREAGPRRDREPREAQHL